MVIDIENEIYTAIEASLPSGVNMSGTYPPGTPDYPLVTMDEMDNSVYEKSQTKTTENHATIMYEFNIYSNRTGKKTECKNILKNIDDKMSEIGFTRIAKLTVPNLVDGTVYRLVARYRAVVGKNKKVFRR